MTLSSYILYSQLFSHDIHITLLLMISSQYYPMKLWSHEIRVPERWLILNSLSWFIGLLRRYLEPPEIGKIGGYLNGNSRILKWRYVCTIFLAIFCGDIPWKLGFKNRPNIYGIGPMNRFTGELSRKVGSIGILPDCRWDNYHLDGLFVGLSS